jgi:hypothetical protein
MDIIPELQKRLPNGQVREGASLPDVKYYEITSEATNQCFTESDGCQWIKSTISVSYQGEKPDHSVERVTLGLIESYLTDFSSQNELVRVTYAYPMIVSGKGRFHMQPVVRAMEDPEIEVFERSFYDVFAAIVSAMDGDTEVTDGQFIYQSLDQLLNRTEQTYSSYLDFKFFGTCRYCSNAEFQDIVHGVVNDPVTLKAFQNRLKNKSGDQKADYFDKLEMVTYSTSDVPEDLQPVSDESIYDSQAPEVSEKNPWYLYFGIACIVVIGGFGFFVIYRDQMELLKEELSTDEESSNAGEESSNGEASAVVTNAEDEITENEKAGDEAETYDGSLNRNTQIEEGEMCEETAAEFQTYDEEAPNFQQLEMADTDMYQSTIVSHYDEPGAHAEYEVYVST